MMFRKLSTLAKRDPNARPPDEGHREQHDEGAGALDDAAILPRDWRPPVRRGLRARGNRQRWHCLSVALVIARPCPAGARRRRG